jgi:hypothetical protein
MRPPRQEMPHPKPLYSNYSLPILTGKNTKRNHVFFVEKWEIGRILQTNKSGWMRKSSPGGGWPIWEGILYV